MKSENSVWCLGGGGGWRVGVGGRLYVVTFCCILTEQVSGALDKLTVRK